MSCWCNSNRPRTVVNVNVSDIIFDRYNDVKGVRNDIEEDIKKLDDEIERLKEIIVKLKRGKKFLEARVEEIQDVKERFDDGDYDD
jgi:peptidoglycan hydrolase CwlO-like protein